MNKTEFLNTYRLMRKEYKKTKDILFDKYLLNGDTNDKIFNMMLSKYSSKVKYDLNRRLFLYSFSKEFNRDYKVRRLSKEVLP